MAWGDDEGRRYGGEEEEDELDENDFKTQKDAVLFAIDASASMLEPPPSSDDKKSDKDSAVVAALKCAHQFMQQRIIAQPKDMMGILLFGTEKSKFRDETGSRSGSGYPHCYLFTELDVPGAEDVKKLRDLVEEGEDADEVLVPSKEPVLMSNVLFCANQIFTTNAANFGSRRLFIITDNENPHGNDKQAKSSAAVRAKDLYDLGVTIELFPVSRAKKPFDLSKFYDDIVYRSSVEEGDNSEGVKTSRSGDGLTLLNSLISNINSKQTPKRSYFSRMPFELAPGLTITVKGYMPLHQQKPARTCYVWLGGEQAQLAQSETTKVDSEARTVEKSEIKKAYKFGGEYIYFTPEEAKSLKELDTKVLRIIGFKPLANLPMWASVKKSTFIFPSEDGYVGSTRVFSALWQKLLTSKKVGIAWFVARKNANPVMVAVIPSGSLNDEDEDSTAPYLPAGLWLYPLPFADDIRSVEIKTSTKPADELTDKMREIIQNLQLPKATYNPLKYPNPALQWHYKILQAMALEEDVPDALDDLTIPKYRQIDKRVGAYMAEWKQELADKAKEFMQLRATKRELEEDDAEERPRLAKRPKAAAGSASSGGQMSNAELKVAWENDTLKKLTVAVLKDILTSKGISTTGKKVDLLERLEQWIEEHA
ncbi:ATP-dependent DNA helicase II subunit 1 [Podospora pseudoanserina]|uniref:ATP-dependent DNA helicase II subunit 1 n=1 Tax=Podospora pseudoanserina TaxID=2609844 RepID=A0ABR0HT62_9PEZI|nr:ATP-dependent DNA helicase II subunit 1 [Podospora pseudoanserina]